MKEIKRSFTNPFNRDRHISWNVLQPMWVYLYSFSNFEVWSCLWESWKWRMMSATTYLENHKLTDWVMFQFMRCSSVCYLCPSWGQNNWSNCREPGRGWWVRWGDGSDRLKQNRFSVFRRVCAVPLGLEFKRGRRISALFDLSHTIENWTDGVTTSENWHQNDSPGKQCHISPHFFIASF